MISADVRAFSRVAETRSYSNAAKLIGVSRSAISKSVTRLEKNLGVSLIRRNPRNVSLTEAGRIFYSHVHEAEDALALAIESIANADQKPCGNISCSLSSTLGAALMPIMIREFRPAWPKLTINMHFGESFVDLVRGSHDVGIRIARKLPDSRLKSRRIGTTRRALVASSSYLAKYGMPKTVHELQSHQCLDLGHATHPRNVWTFQDNNQESNVTVTCTVTSNSHLPLISAACMGGGIIYIHDILISHEVASGRLIPILSEFWDPAPVGIFAIHSYSKPPAKVRVFIDFVERSLPMLHLVDR